MALDKLAILFKKIVGRVSPTLNTLDYYEEIAKKTNDLVELSQIWLDSSNIIPTNPIQNDIVGTTWGLGYNGLQYDIIEKVQVRLYRLLGTGTNSSTYVETIGDTHNQPAKDFNDRILTNIINNNIFGFTYSPKYYNTSNVEINIYDVNLEGFFDYGSGVLSFYGNSFYNSNYIDVVAYKYIGKFGDEILSIINNAGGNPSLLNKFMVTNTATAENMAPALDRSNPNNFLLGLPQNQSYINVELNGVSVRLANGLNLSTNLDNDGKEFDCIFSKITDSKNVLLFSANQLTINTVDMTELQLQSNCYIEIIDNLSQINLRRVISFDTQNINYSGTDIANPISVRKVIMKSFSDIEIGDLLRWNSIYAEYGIDTDDVISFHYNE